MPILENINLIIPKGNIINKLLTLGHKLITKGDKDSYFDAFWCFDLAVRLHPESFEARLGEYKAWYCISISQDPTLSITDGLYRILYAYTRGKPRIVESYSMAGNVLKTAMF